MSNYPAGVTGNEYAIAGGTAVRGTITMDVEHDCDEGLFEESFEGTAEVDDIEYYGGEFSGYFTCPQCGTQGLLHTWDAPDDDGYDG